MKFANGDHVAARDSQARAVMLCHKLGNRLGEARAHLDIAQNAEGERAGAVATLTEMHKMFRHLGYRYLEAKALHHLGIMRHRTATMLLPYQLPTLLYQMNQVSVS